MNILVLGGSYFLGKQFVNMAREKHQVTLFNRGNRPLGLPQVKELIGDRHDIGARKALTGQHFDAVVDFCAYEEKDIASVISQLSPKPSQYIFVSTCDVYMHGTGRIMDEGEVFEERSFPGEGGSYIAGKVVLERELETCGKDAGIFYTSIRPAIIYGPENYAPRESIYFRWIKQAGQILHPTDATGVFQMVYVKDVAKGILNAIGNEAAYNEAFNFAPLKETTYDSFGEALRKSVPLSFEQIPISLQTVFEKQIALPFPLTREESNLYCGEKALQLIGSYTPLDEGLKETAAWEF